MPRIALFQYTGFNELNRAMLSEAPVARTPFELAAVGDEVVGDIPGVGKVPLPTTRAGIAIWTKAILGTQTYEVTPAKTARADEPRRETTTATPKLDRKQ